MDPQIDEWPQQCAHHSGSVKRSCQSFSTCAILGLLVAETCPACSHAAHGSDGCGDCAILNTTCWQRIQIVGGDGDRAAAGEIDLATGMETRPCLNCKSFEADRTRLIQHIVAMGLVPDANGIFETPIAKDFKGRRSLKLDVRNFGWCKKDCCVVDMLASCPRFRPLRTAEELATRIRSRA